MANFCFQLIKMADPWVVQPHEHAKFAEHFRNLGPVNGALTGEQAKRFMLQVSHMNKNIM